jgi:hypothetical protein
MLVESLILDHNGDEKSAVKLKSSDIAIEDWLRTL